MPSLQGVIVRTAVGSHEGFGPYLQANDLRNTHVRTAVGSHEGFGPTTRSAPATFAAMLERPLAPMRDLDDLVSSLTKKLFPS